MAEEAERIRLAEEAEQIRLAEEEAEQIRLAEEEAKRIRLAAQERSRKGQEDKKRALEQAEIKKQQKAVIAQQQQELAKQQAERRAIVLAREKAEELAKKVPIEKIMGNIKLIELKIKEIKGKLDKNIIEGTSNIIDDIDSLNKENIKFRDENPGNENIDKIIITSRAISDIKEEISKVTLRNAKKTQSESINGSCNIM